MRYRSVQVVLTAQSVEQTTWTFRNRMSVESHVNSPALRKRARGVKLRAQARRSAAIFSAANIPRMDNIKREMSPKILAPR